MKVGIIFLVASIGGALLTGCAGTKRSENVSAPDGTSEKRISCAAITLCYDEATRICAGNYQVLRTEDYTDDPQLANTTKSELLVKCD